MLRPESCNAVLLPVGLVLTDAVEMPFSDSDAALDAEVSDTIHPSPR